MLAAVVFTIIRERLLMELGDRHSPDWVGHLSSSLGPGPRQVIGQMVVTKMSVDPQKYAEWSTS